MKKITSYLLLAFLLIGCSGEKKGNESRGEGSLVNELQTVGKEADSRRYPIERGIIHATNEAMGVEMTMVTYFDKWGEWEAIETTVPMEIWGTDYTARTLEIIKGDDHWKIDLEEKTGEHFKQSRVINQLGVDMDKLSEEVLGKFDMEDLGEVDFLGYKCRRMRMKSDMSTAMDYVMWGNVMMQMEGEAMGVPTSMRVTSVEETTPPREVFDVPEGIDFIE